MKRNISMVLGICFAVVAFTIVSCSKSCDIKLKNGSKAEIKVHTKTPDASGNLVEDVATLKPGEDVKIGMCQDCAAINDEEIKATAMLVSVGTDELELKDKKEILNFLNELKSEGCGIKIFQ